MAPTQETQDHPAQTMKTTQKRVAAAFHEETTLHRKKARLHPKVVLTTVRQEKAPLRQKVVLRTTTLRNQTTAGKKNVGVRRRVNP